MPAPNARLTRTCTSLSPRVCDLVLEAAEHELGQQQQQQQGGSRQGRGQAPAATAAGSSGSGSSAGQQQQLVWLQLLDMFGKDTPALVSRC